MLTLEAEDDYVQKLNVLLNYRRRVYTSGFSHVFTALHCVFLILTLAWFNQGSFEKSQCNAENACGNRMWQLGFSGFRKSFRNPFRAAFLKWGIAKHA